MKLNNIIQMYNPICQVWLRVIKEDTALAFKLLSRLQLIILLNFWLNLLIPILSSFFRTLNLKTQIAKMRSQKTVYQKTTR